MALRLHGICERFEADWRSNQPARIEDVIAAAGEPGLPELLRELIALELELSTSTVRTHLHNTYAKLGAVDRAQAVLIATQRGWI